MLNYFLYSLNDGITYVGGIVSLLGTIITIISFFTDRKNKIPLKIAILIVFGLCFGISVYASKLEKVPNVTNIFYSNACNILAENDLRFNLEYDDGTMVVIGQDPAEDVIVPKGSFVWMEIRDLTEDEIRIQKFYEENANKELLECEIALFHKKIEFSDGICSMYYGETISYTEGMELFLYNESENITLREYEILDDNLILFKNVPSGFDYVLHCNSNEYDDFECKFKASSSSAVDNRMKIDIHLTKNDDELMYPCRIRIVDSNNNFLKDVKCYVAYDDVRGRYWYDGGITDQDGNLGVNVCTSEDITVWVKVQDPYGNGTDYECEVPIKVAKIGEPIDSSIIKVYKNGNSEVMFTSDFYYW